MSDLIERVARALAEIDRWPGVWDMLDHLARVSYSEMAKAAIAEMQKPQPVPEGFVRVRIAVGVSPSGEWDASGYHEWTDEYAITEVILSGLVSMVTADVPKPVTQEIVGKVDGA